ncbi:cytochrome P460 family protein [Psychroserpens jangbogonensis]|uniref:cytochrome P460 family protein n=1 Tax=Psychroserpens jangbogonensis TaxID=1484460 RepID=UPI00053E599A|nr:cytochrome P460 family protein [Psychroserpens jangbogonensis]
MNKLKYILVMMITMVIVTSCNENSNYIEATYFTMDSNGELIRPVDYRTWIYVGTPLTPNDMNNGKAAFPEFHNVYIDPISYKQYKKTGTWREGTILIKELVNVGSKAAVSGNGYFMGEFIGLEATIKSKEHFPDEPGNWAYFSFTNPTGGTLAATGKAFETAQCNSCHNSSAGDDFVFTQHYPVLRAAKGVGEEVTPENTAKR